MLAVILDEFSQHTFATETKVLPLTLQGWKHEIIQQKVELLLVESAWWGANKSWHGKVNTASAELQELLVWCRRANVPTVFWNKEDPVHFDRFLQTACLFDWVFTTDASVIPHYKSALGHSRVALLPFAAQPHIHHPIQPAQREMSACFAGSFYVRYPQRTKVLQQMLSGLGALMPIRIYDRYLGSTDANYRFPTEYQSWIVGTLKEHELPLAYKSHWLGINLNTVESSSTMCARRIFELLGSGSVVFSNATPAVQRLFGDIVVTGETSEEFADQAKAILVDKGAWTKRSMAGVRNVMRHHTLADRVDKIYRLVLGRSFKQAGPFLFAVAQVSRVQQLDDLRLFIKSQTRKPDGLLVLGDQSVLTPQVQAELQELVFLVRFLPPDAADNTTLRELLVDLLPASECDKKVWWTVLNAGHGVSSVYLEDWMHAAQYSQASVVGYAQVPQPQPGPVVVGNGCMVRHDLCAHFTLFECMQGAWHAEVTSPEQSLLLPATDPWVHVVEPIPYPDLEAWADAQVPWSRPASVVPCVSPETLANWFTPWGGRASTASLDTFGWFMVSELRDGDTAEHWSCECLRPNVVRAHGVWRFRLELTGVLNVAMGIRCWDEDQENLSHEIFLRPNENHELTLPFGTRKLQLGWRITGSGSCRVKALHLGWTSWSKKLPTTWPPPDLPGVMDNFFSLTADIAESFKGDSSER